MGLGVLDVLGSIGSGITTATQRNSLTRTQRRQEEEARKRQLLAGLPQEVRMAVTEKSMTRPDSDFEAIISESIQEFKDKEQQTEISRINKAQRDAEILEEQSATDAFIEGTQGRSFAPITTILGEEPGRPVTKEEATALATAGQQGQGLDVLTRINKAQRDAARIAVDTKIQTEVRDIRKSAEKPSVDFDALIGRAKAISAMDVVQELEEMKENRAALKRDALSRGVSERQLEAEDKLIGEFDRSSEKMLSAQDSMTKVVQLSKGESGFDDIALIFAFMKMHDPDSVVRETEFGTVEATGPISAFATQIIENFNSSRRLTKAQRQEILNTTKGVYDGQVALHEKRLSQFQKRAKKRGLDVDIFSDYTFVPGLDDDSSSSDEPPLDYKTMDENEIKQRALDGDEDAVAEFNERGL
jgi:hypothetical protein